MAGSHLCFTYSVALRHAQDIRSVETSVSPLYCTWVSCKEQFHFVSPLYSIWLLHSETSSNKALLVKQETQLTASHSPSVFSEGEKCTGLTGQSMPVPQWRQRREEKGEHLCGAESQVPHAQCPLQLQPLPGNTERMQEPVSGPISALLQEPPIQLLPLTLPASESGPLHLSCIRHPMPLGYIQA